MAGAPVQHNRISAIACPIQRVLASHLTEIEDLFCAQFAAIDPEARFVRPPGDAGDGTERIVNLTRMLVIGCVGRLGLDIGLGSHAIHGHHAGYTEVVELKVVHWQTMKKAIEMFDALAEDRGEVGKLVASRYRQIRAAALRESDALKPITPRHLPVLDGITRPQKRPRPFRPSEVRKRVVAAEAAEAAASEPAPARKSRAKTGPTRRRRPK